MQLFVHFIMVFLKKKIMDPRLSINQLLAAGILVKPFQFQNNLTARSRFRFVQITFNFADKMSDGIRYLLPNITSHPRENLITWWIDFRIKQSMLIFESLIKTMVVVNKNDFDSCVLDVDIVAFATLVECETWDKRFTYPPIDMESPFYDLWVGLPENKYTKRNGIDIEIVPTC